MKEALKDKYRLKHILEAINEIQFYIQDVSKEEFVDNSMMRFACIKQLEIVGEAANHLSEEFKAANHQVEWRQIIGMRNVFVHEYFVLDNNILWDIVCYDVPRLKIDISNIYTD